MTMPPKHGRATKAETRALCDLRERLGLTQSEMADKLGVTMRMYRYYEAGSPIPRPVQILVSLIKAGKY